MATKFDILTGEGKTLKAIHRLPTDPLEAIAKEVLVVMSHGFPGHKSGNNDVFGDLEHQLSERGCHTLRFDYRGCGESDGKEEEFSLAAATEDFKSARSWAKEKGYKEFVYIGEGLGAALCALNSDLNVKAMIMLWPVLDLGLYAENAFNVKENITAKARGDGHIKLNDHKIGLPLLKELKKQKLVHALGEMFMPVLIIQGARDDILPAKQLDLAREYIRSSRIEITTFHDGEHGLQKLNHRKVMFYHIAQFIEKYI